VPCADDTEMMTGLVLEAHSLREVLGYNLQISTTFIPSVLVF
jgi:hypothetical protein